LLTQNTNPPPSQQVVEEIHNLNNWHVKIFHGLQVCEILAAKALFKMNILRDNDANK
jgi:hypothetical protein